MALFSLRPKGAEAPVSAALGAFLEGTSIEVMPRTAEKIDSFAAIFPTGTRVYVAHIEGTPIDDMVATARRLTDEGFPVMPHIPARLIADRAMLDTWLKRYRDDAGVTQALVLAGGIEKPLGAYESAIDLLKTGMFDELGFTRLHVAGHPEGNKDIDRKGGTAEVDKALIWKQDYAKNSDADFAIATQFGFSSTPIIAWAERLAGLGITLPVHLGVAGPTKLQTLIKYAIACGVGPSLGVLQKRAMDLTKLLVPFAPTAMLTEIAAYRTTNPDSLLKEVHLFPLGGIKASATWLRESRASD